jgi:four helix bundle protein
MKSYKELEVWQKAVKLAVEIYRITQTFPKEELYGLTSQIRRASTSVSANIAEGWGRGSTKEYIQFLLIARGSLMELETHLIIAQELNYLNQQQLEKMQAEIESMGMMLNRLIQSLRNDRGSGLGIRDSGKTEKNEP